MLYVKEQCENTGMRTGLLSAFGSKSEVSPSRESSRWISAVDQLIKKKKWVKPSSDRSETDSSSLGCSDDKGPEVNILRGVTKVSSRIKAQIFRSADFSLLRVLLGRIPGGPRGQRSSGVLGDFWTQHSPSTRAVHSHKVEKEPAQKPVWLNSELLRERN